MNKLSSVTSLLTQLDEALNRLETIKHKVKHGKYKIQRKKVKAQVLKDKTPRDIERENICKKAREKAHTVISNTKRDMSNDTRERTTSCHEGLQIINESATTLSGLYGLDFLEEAVGWDIKFTFFDKPQATPLSESLDVGTTKTGRKRKCRAIGIAEGVFAPIFNAEGDRVFSRNKRLYESDHWEYQLEDLNFFNRVHSRRMLGMIGHEDKKITDADLREGRVSHVVSDLEIREDEEHGRYLWGRLEILNTEAGRNLKEYYENDIPLFVSSRGGGKLIDVPGKNYKKVDKTRYYCESFDVVKEPGFLEAAPIYHGINEENNEVSEAEELISQLSECLGIEEAKLLEVIENTNVINEDNEMSKVNVNIDTKNDSAEEIINKLLKPVTEKMESKLAEITNKLNALESDLNDTEAVADVSAEEAPVEAEPAKAEEAPAEIKEEKEAETTAEEAPVEAEPAKEVIEEGKEDCPECGDKKKEDCPKCNDKDGKEAGKEAGKDEKKDDKKEAIKECSEDAAEGTAEAPAEEAKVETEPAKAEEAPAEAANEAWAQNDPKETVTTVADLPKPALPNGGEPKDLGNGAWAKEDPKETVTTKADIAGGKDAKKDELEKKVEAEIHAAEAKDAAAVNAGVEGGACVTAHEAKEEKAEVEVSEADTASADTAEAPVAGDAAEFTQQVTDYKAMYEALKDEFEECTKEIDDLLESIDSFGKRHKEVVLESKKELDSVKEQLDTANKALNSYKLQEQFNITVEKANELLSSKTYETVVEELKAAETQQTEQETQAKAEAVSESLSESTTQAAPVVRRKAYSAFSANLSESKDEENETLSESVETPKRRRAYSAF